MDLGHVHLMLNHLPVLGAPALLALLVWGVIRDIPVIVRAALWLTTALGVVTLLVYLTGEAAEELVEGLPTFAEPLVERHEDVALWATIVVVTTGLLAGAALFRRPRPERRGPATLARLVIVGLTLSTAAVALTAWTGGPIGHPELRAGSGSNRSSASNGSVLEHVRR